VSPAEEYTQRLRAREVQVAHFDKVHGRISTLRLLIFVVTALAAWGAVQLNAFSPWWLLLPSVLFAGVAVYHSSIRRARSRAERAAAVYKRGLARIEDRWSGQGQGGERFGERFNDPHHVYAADLDLFGTGSLFELLSIARTRMGESTLARWLLSPAPAAEILDRQASIAELRQLLDLREELAILGEDTDISVRPDALLAWAESPNLLTQRWMPWLALLLPLLAAVGAIIWSVWGIASPFLLVLLIEAGVMRLFAKQLQQILYGTENAFDDLKLLAALPARLEREPFKSAQLQQLVGKLASHDLQASRTIARLGTIVQLIESRRNPILAVLQVPLLYPLHAALAAERWRRAHGDAVRSWLDVIGTIEALISLGAYSYEHADDPFPQLIEGPAAFHGESLGHPLIPAASCVRNDVSIEGKTRALLISGSNMSGKSTLLRTVGINTVLAMAGGPVRARSLRLTPLQVGASIRINDSLHEGSSRFYAEITRLRQLHELSSRTPSLLFLLDEVLQGTNSRDRRIGAEGVVRAFMEQGAIGMISTHDLALTDIDVGGAGRLRNMHFQDELVDGRMKFDFTLREGVVTRSNGIELMRSIGLRV
jgi:hypothetical protein